MYSLQTVTFLCTYYSVMFFSVLRECKYNLSRRLVCWIFMHYFKCEQVTFFVTCLVLLLKRPSFSFWLSSQIQTPLRSTSKSFQIASEGKAYPLGMKLDCTLLLWGNTCFFIPRRSCHFPDAKLCHMGPVAVYVVRSCLWGNISYFTANLPFISDKARCNSLYWPIRDWHWHLRNTNKKAVQTDRVDWRSGA